MSKAEKLILERIPRFNPSVKIICPDQKMIVCTQHNDHSFFKQKLRFASLETKNHPSNSGIRFLKVHQDN